MLNQSPDIRIYLADRRRAEQSETYQALFTLPFKADDNVYSFESLNVFCEVTQKPGTIVHHTCSTSGALFVLPLVGKVALHDLKNETAIDAGQLLHAGITQGLQIEFKNSYQSEWISYLVWEIQTERKPHTAIVDFDIEAAAGALVDVVNKADQSIPITVQVGMFNGRQEEVLTYQTSQHEFIFVIEGAFEVQKRLLHARDGLSLPHCQSMEFEALSNQAIILILSLH